MLPSPTIMIIHMIFDDYMRNLSLTLQQSLKFEIIAVRKPCQGSTGYCELVVELSAECG